MSAARALLPAAVLRRRIERLGKFGLSGVHFVGLGDAVYVSSTTGLADRVDRIPLDTDTIFDIGSLSKQFTAAAVLRLEEVGAVRLDDPVKRFFDGVPADKREITLRDLLTHSSGLRRDHVASDFEPLTAEEAARRIFELTVHSAPGAVWSYSNAGYSLLGIIVERAAGRDYQAFARDELFAPAGLASTGWYGDPLLQGRTWARGYGGRRDFGSPSEWPEPGWGLLGNGGVCASARDLHRWARALDTGRVLSERSREAMWTEVIGGYGYGWDVARAPSAGRVVGHTGANWFGFSSAIQHYPDIGITNILLTNATYRGQHLIWTAAGEMAAGIFEDSPSGLDLPPLARSSTPIPCPGQYDCRDDGERFKVWTEAGQPVIGGCNQRAADLLTGRTAFPHDESLRERSLAVINGLMAKRPEAVDSLAAVPEARDSLRQVIEETWRAVTNSEAVVGVPVYMGLLPTLRGETVPSVLSDSGVAVVTSIVRITTQTGPACLRLVWSDAGLVGVETAQGELEALGAYWLAPSHTGHVGLDLITGCRIEVTVDDDTLLLHARGRMLLLTRQEDAA